MVYQTQNQPEGKGVYIAKLFGLSLSPSAPQGNGDEVDECEAILDELASNVLM